MTRITDRPLGRHSISAVVGAAIAVGAMSLIPFLRPEKVVERRVERQVQTAGKWTWGELTPIEQSSAVFAISGAMRGLKVQIFCGGSWCSDLAEDLDEVMDQAGADSAHVRPAFDATDAAGKPIAGIGMWPKTDATVRIAGGISAATNGRIDIRVMDAPTGDKSDSVVIVIGRKPRK